MAATDPRYPIGKLQRPATVDSVQRRAFMDQLGAAPAALRKAVQGLNDKQLDTPYRDGGWTLRQVVHHLADSHLNAYVRVKFALTEQEPRVMVWQEQLWAELPDGRSMPVEPSLQIFDSVHQRWLGALREQPEAVFQRAVMHPENGRLTIDALLATYAWHGAHHTAHITTLRKAKNW
jgi:uncharacterized damage-inducible protein DinB